MRTTVAPRLCIFSRADIPGPMSEERRQVYREQGRKLQQRLSHGGALPAVSDPVPPVGAAARILQETSHHSRKTTAPLQGQTAPGAPLADREVWSRAKGMRDKEVGLLERPHLGNTAPQCGAGDVWDRGRNPYFGTICGVKHKEKTRPSPPSCSFAAGSGIGTTGKRKGI